ncbi:hypothetical protein HD806DRAFT_474001 [Xylariaceae sp. AK1471]|nr:hypothetical protein HD806DRAFT_474001 [Xylariaceae sp. AK1471]
MDNPRFTPGYPLSLALVLAILPRVSSAFPNPLRNILQIEHHGDRQILLSAKDARLFLVELTHLALLVPDAKFQVPKGHYAIHSKMTCLLAISSITIATYS